MLTFREWKLHWKQLDWTRKWFPVFLFLRPIADNFYFLKSYGTIYSPIYILGVLTPILCIASISRMKNIRSAPSDQYMRIWGILIVVNGIALLSFDLTMDNFGNMLKYISPPLLFFYLRYFVQSKRDLVFLLQTFLYSAIYPFLSMAFELAFGPIDPEYVSAGRGGGARLRGYYADSANYFIYFINTVIISVYFFLDRIYSKAKTSPMTTTRLLLIFLASLIGIIQLRHVTTWGALAVIIALLLYFNSKNVRGYGVLIVVGLIVLPVLSTLVYDQYIYPLIAKEFNVWEGDVDIQYGFNGRISRWERYFEIWDQMPSIAHFFGVSFSGFRQAPIMMSGGMHNDFVRILFLSGIFGVALYVFFILSVFFRWTVFRAPERFLILTSVAALMMYSMTTLPMIYPGFQYVFFSVFSFALLKKQKAYGLPASRPIYRPPAAPPLPGPEPAPAASP
jgi:O-antigen ligase